MIRSFLGAVMLAVLTGVSAAPTPSPTPLAGFSSRGTLSVSANVMSKPVSLNAEVAVWSKRGHARLDVLKFSTSGAQNPNAMVNQFLPAGTITVVYDQATKATTMWSDSKREYFQSKAVPHAKLKPAQKPKEPAESPIDQILKATRSITEYDSFSESLNLTGHQIINGHISSLFHFRMQGQKHGGKLRDLTGDMAFADDLSGIPVRLWMISKGEFEGEVKLDLLSASAAVPDASLFKVPAGYKKVASIMQLFAKSP
ncbi:MAG: hypothetical protein ABR584_10895 [Candidatus Baltobacteraceae bacterium]